MNDSGWLTETVRPRCFSHTQGAWPHRPSVLRLVADGGQLNTIKAHLCDKMSAEVDLNFNKTKSNH